MSFAPRFESWEIRDRDNSEVYCRDCLLGETWSTQKYLGWQRRMLDWIEGQKEKKVRVAA